MNKIKEFLKPTPLKIILTIVSFVLAHVIQFIFRMGVMDYWFLGVPLKFEEAWGPCHPSETVCHSSNWFFLVIDIIFWYIIAALIYLGIRKIKKGNKNEIKGFY